MGVEIEVGVGSWEEQWGLEIDLGDVSAKLLQDRGK